MTFVNVVHMRVRPDRQAEYVEIHRDFQPSAIAGCLRFELVQSGERDFIVIGEWEDREALVAARPQMIANLDRLRPILEDLGGGRGVTEPWSGEVVLSAVP
jgi:quinol monooxygenase YgiN